MLLPWFMKRAKALTFWKDIKSLHRFSMNKYVMKNINDQFGTNWNVKCACYSCIDTKLTSKYKSKYRRLISISWSSHCSWTAHCTIGTYRTSVKWYIISNRKGFIEVGKPQWNIQRYMQGLDSQGAPLHILLKLSKDWGRFENICW